MTKLQTRLYDKAIADIRKFCKKNRIAMPNIDIVDTVAKNKKAWCGWYVWGSDDITVVPRACITIATTPGHRWHYPRYYNDLSIYGVICHEFGHYVHFKRLLKYDKASFKYEAPLSKYENNYIETIAEIVKLLVVNPDLLRRVNPRRYEFITDICKLKPATTQTWKERLGKNIHPKYVECCRKRVSLAKSRR